MPSRWIAAALVAGGFACFVAAWELDAQNGRSFDDLVFLQQAALVLAGVIALITAGGLVAGGLI